MRTIATTESALWWLIERGFLLEEKIAGGQSIYRLDPGKRREAELLLSGRRMRRAFSIRRSAAR